MLEISDIQARKIDSYVRRLRRAVNPVLVRAFQPLENSLERVRVAFSEGGGVDHAPEGVVLVSVAVVPAGPVLVLAVPDRSALVPWLTWSAQRLSDAGLEGSLELLEEERCPIGIPVDPIASVLLGMALSGGRAGSGASWPPALIDSVVNRVLEWCLEVSGDVYFDHVGSRVRCEPSSVGKLVRLALELEAPVRVTCVAGEIFRNVVFDKWGHLILERSRDGGLENSIEDLTQSLKSFGPELLYGFVKPGVGPVGSWMRALSSIEPLTLNVAGNYMNFVNEADEASKVPDAFCLQLLTEQHLARARDLSEWSVERVDEQYLVRAKDVSPWFANESTRLATVDIARADLGDLIMASPRG